MSWIMPLFLKSTIAHSTVLWNTSYIKDLPWDFLLSVVTGWSIHQINIYLINLWDCFSLSVFIEHLTKERGVCVCVLCMHMHARTYSRLKQIPRPSQFDPKLGFSEGNSNAELRLLDLVYCFSPAVQFISYSIFQSLWHKPQTYSCRNVHWIQ